MKARAERFEKGYGIKVNVVHKGHYGKVQSAMMSSAGTSDIGDVARGYGNAAADMYIIGASIDQTPFANSKKWGVTQADIDDWGANWTVGFSPYFDAVSYTHLPLHFHSLLLHHLYLKYQLKTS